MAATAVPQLLHQLYPNTCIPRGGGGRRGGRDAAPEGVAAGGGRADGGPDRPQEAQRGRWVLGWPGGIEEGWGTLSMRITSQKSYLLDLLVHVA